MSSHHVIESLSISSGVHFRELALTFDPRLNAIIGGRGAGKSGVLYHLRFGLGTPIPVAYAEQLDDYVSGTLGTGVVTASLRTGHGAKLTCTRSHGSDPVVRDENGVVVNVSLDGELFKIEAYAQGEIEGIGRDPAAALVLLDKFAQVDIRRIDDAVAQLERKLAQNDAQRRRIEDEIADDAAREGELPSVIEALKGVDLGGAEAGGARQQRAVAHEAKVQRGRERAAMAALASDLESVRADLDVFAREALKKLGRAVEGDFERGPHAEIFRRAHAAMQRVAGALEGGAERLGSEIGAAERAVAEDGRALAAEHAKEDEAYRALVVLDDADRVRAQESERLHKRFAELSTVAKRLADLRRQEAAVREEGEALFAAWAKLLEEKSAVRAGVAAKVSAALEGEVRVSIAPAADETPFAKLLVEILQGANIRPAAFIQTIAHRIPPRMLASIARRNELGPIIDLDPVNRGKEERASKILAHLRASGRLFEIETARREDAPLIELRVGKTWRASNKLSTGQRCSCILQIVLVQSNVPLLIDQAEDSLDNLFIYEVLVKRLAEAKLHRQVILVTHNPNPVSLAEADRVIVLGIDEDANGRLVAAGPFDDVREHAELVLEGGREAFRKRAERYGHRLVPE